MPGKQTTEEIWIHLSSRLKTFILSKIPDKDVAEDILQEVFIRIHLKIDTLKDETRLKAWLYQITRNLIADHYRQNVRMENATNTEADQVRISTDVDMMEEATRDMINMMRDLPPDYCEALCMTELNGLSQKEYAEKVGIPYSSAKSRVQRSRKLLKDMLMKCCHYQFDKYGTVLNILPNTCCCCNPHGHS